MSVKKMFLFFLFVLSCIGAGYCQDVFVFKNGDEVKVKVLEINTSDIKYKKWDNQQGPTYTVLKNELFMIKYQNGTRDVFKEEATAPVPQQQTASPIQVQPAPTDNSAALEQQRKQEYHDQNMALFRKRLGKGIGLTAAGGALFVTGLPLFVWGVSGYTAFSDLQSQGFSTLNYEIGMTIGALFTAASIPMIIIGPYNLSKAFKHRRMAKSGTAFSFAPYSSSLHNKTGFKSGGFASGMSLQLRF